MLAVLFETAGLAEKFAYVYCVYVDNYESKKLRVSRWHILNGGSINLAHPLTFEAGGSIIHKYT